MVTGLRLAVNACLRLQPEGGGGQPGEVQDQQQAAAQQVQVCGGLGCLSSKFKPLVDMLVELSSWSRFGTYEKYSSCNA